MATKSVATNKQNADIPETSHDLWTRGGDVLTVKLSRNSPGFPPGNEALDNLHEVIIGLAKAIVSIAHQLEDEVIEQGDMWHTGLALNGIADAIVLHASLAEGVSVELAREPALSEVAA